MRNHLYIKYQELKKNTSNKVIYFEQNERIEKDFASFSDDIDKDIKILKALEEQKKGIKRVGILGTTSYRWMTLDHACIKGGYKSAGLPETLNIEALDKIIKDLNIDLVLVDFKLKEKYEKLDCIHIYYFNCTKLVVNDIEAINVQKQIISEENLIQEDYSIVFSSGTSENIKYINRRFFEFKKQKTSFLKKVKEYWWFRGSIWYIIKNKSKNKLIIYLPFSHPMQRWFVQIAINNKLDIVLSDPKNCIKHIMIEKPNIMVSIPPIYDAMASMIESRIRRFDPKQQKLFRLFIKYRINTFRDNNPLKKYFSKRLFRKVKRVYGGKADLFITGSAPIKKETLQTFEKIGVRLYEAYSQSELSTIIMNSPRHYKLGSVGKPEKNLAVKIGKRDEILIKFNEDYDSVNKQVLNIKNEYIHTGDTGYIDKQGFLYITGRLDDVIVLERGKKIHPDKIQNKLSVLLDNSHVLVYSLNKESIACLVFSKVLTNTRVQSQILNLNKSLASYERIKKFTIIKEEPSVENGLLTTTLKLKRKIILEKYVKLENIDAQA